MNDSFGGEFNATQTASAGAASEQKAEGIAPVLIKQVVESPEGNFQMFGMNFGMVACAAIVRAIETSSTKITYLLEDYTGRIEAHYWLEEGDALKSPDVMINNYAKVYGSVRSQSGKKTLMVFKMIPVTDPNEICTHILEVLNARFMSESFSKGGAVEGEIEKMDTNAANAAPAVNVGLVGKELAVYQAIKSRADDAGISRYQLMSKFSHINKNEMDQILDSLSAEGHIYCTTDSDHFVATESG